MVLPSGPGSIGLRLQNLDQKNQVLVLARIAEPRGEDLRFNPAIVETLFEELRISRPSNISATLSRLEADGLVSRKRGRGTVWALTPLGRSRSSTLASDIDVLSLEAEARASKAPEFGHAVHPTIPPTLAPPELLPGLSSFLNEFPFETNVFGMTRFPAADVQGGDSDPIAQVLNTVKSVCANHGLAFHIASERSLHDDLWSNVAAHMWGCRYGVAFFEDLQNEGLNYNLTIEVGAMLISGRRCALLKDPSVEKLPTDLVGRIYKDVSLAAHDKVRVMIHSWIRDDLALGRCSKCS